MAESAKILIIDDEPILRQVMVNFLEALGYDSCEAENGRIGIEMCRRELPDLVMSDLRMPEVDGFEVLATITKEFPEIPVIMVTGMGDMRDVITSIKLGAWDYITKPIEDIAVISHAVEKALERSRLLRENREHREHLEIVNRQLTDSLQKLEDDETAARKMQFHLLPDNNQTWGHYHFSRALYPSLYLSGDFVDYFSIDSDHIGFFMADVSGHGVSSALVTFFLRSYMHHRVKRYMQGRDPDTLHPEAILMGMNRSLLQEDLDKSLTIFYGILKLSDNTLHYCNAGQFPYPILNDGGRTAFIEGKGLPIGIFEKANYQAATIALPDRFDLVLFSDGILEILPQDSLNDKKACLLSLISNVEDITIDALTNNLALGKGVNPPDDIALLIIRRR